MQSKSSIEITADKLQVLRSHSIGRISVNPQTMEDSVLRAMGRAHTAAQIEQAMELARAHFGGMVNMHLIAGLPTDSLATEYTVKTQSTS